jgi:hypothetical protein
MNTFIFLIFQISLPLLTQLVPCPSSLLRIASYHPQQHLRYLFIPVVKFTMLKDVLQDLCVLFPDYLVQIKFFKIKHPFNFPVRI